VRVLPDGTSKISFQPQRNPLSIIQKVEIVNPAPEPRKSWRLLLQLFIGLNLRVLFVFWFVASWFPELGLTYWALILPVYIAMWIFRAPSARQITAKNLRRHRYQNPISGDISTEDEEIEPHKA
jgi:hypothetical protein